MQPAQGKLGNFTLLALWFGASVSIAEIMTGGLLAPMGFSAAFVGIVVGHVIGAVILFLGGTIGARSGLPSMVSTQMSFGIAGSWVFALLNLLQLIGWTAIMIMTGASAANEISILLFGVDHKTAWSLAFGVAIIVWIGLGKTGFSRLNVIAVMLLLGLTVLLGTIVLSKDVVYTVAPTSAGLPLGLALELSIIMPLSWLPLIADYTRFAKDKKWGVRSSALGYFVGSTLMYVIGMGAALYSGSADPAKMMLAANLGLFALGIVVLSTITTTFLDAYSAGVSTVAIFPKANEKLMALIMTAIGLGLALWVPMHQYEYFLYAIGSVFGPLFAIVLTDYFLFNTRTLSPTLALHVNAMGVWVVGVGLYYVFKSFDWSLGSVLPTMLATALLFAVVTKVTTPLKIEKEG